MIHTLIARYKGLRTERYLAQTYKNTYAFVGMGQHSLTNLYPVLHYLGVPLKYICVTSERKARLINRKYPLVKATTSLCDILSDETVKGVFVSASPTSHFSIASQILKCGKSLFIEKPPCLSIQELDSLIDQQRHYCSRIAMVGLQKRYAPAIQLLKKRLSNEHIISYDIHYLTGAYSEGDTLLDLFIHPLDLVTYLFGMPEIIASQCIAEDSFILMFRHQHIVGTLELSSLYNWNATEESLTVCTSKGMYHLSQMETLTYEANPSTILCIPIEKIRPWNKTIEYLYYQNRFLPTLPNNQIHSQGYFNELQAFVDAVEGHHYHIVTDLESVRDVYKIIVKLTKR